MQIRRAAKDKVLASYTVQDGAETRVFYGHFYFDTFDRETTKALTHDDFKHITALSFYVTPSSFSNIYVISLNHAWFFKKKENCLIEFKDCKCELIYKDNHIKQAEVVFVFIGTATDPQNRTLEKQNQLIEDKITMQISIPREYAVFAYVRYAAFSLLITR